jgi:Ca2+/H+ antiporter
MTPYEVIMFIYLMKVYEAMLVENIIIGVILIDINLLIFLYVNDKYS